MELAQRFKKQLDKRDIYSNSKPIQNILVEEKEEKIEKEVSSTKVTCPIENNSLENLKNELISKINNTPYWEEFSKNRQEKMISSYIDVSLKKQRFSNIECSNEQKLSLIKSIVDFIFGN